MHRVPLAAIELIEQRLVAAVIADERLPLPAIAYDTTNFFTHLETTNARGQLAQRGHSKPRRHDLRQLERILSRQYVRQVLQCAVQAQGKAVAVRPWIDPPARQHLEQTYFGLRLLATTREEWTTAQIIEAYRGQSRVERAFRDLKDPWVCAFRPQYHGTDQKLVVHALIAVLSLLLERVLLRRARRAGYHGILRSLVQQLGCIRTECSAA